MSDYDARSYPTICPYVFYEDLATALQWLVDSFGFTEKMRTTRPDGALGHCEIQFGNSVVMLGTPEGFRSRDRSGPAAFGIYVHVDDVDAHFERAKAAGAQVQDTPTNQAYGVRSYGVLDLEGNQWWFAQPL